MYICGEAWIERRSLDIRGSSAHIGRAAADRRQISASSSRQRTEERLAQQVYRCAFDRASSSKILLMSARFMNCSLPSARVLFKNFSSSSWVLASELKARPRWYIVSSRALSSATSSSSLGGEVLTDDVSCDAGPGSAR